MPTRTQFEELTNYTTHTWTSVNGVNGRKLTSKSDSNKYIFLPAGGYWNNTTHSGAGSDGYYRSTAWNSETPSRGWSMNLNSSGVWWDQGPRYYGHSVRGIQ